MSQEIKMVATSTNITKLQNQGYKVISHNEDFINPWHKITKLIVNIAKCIPLIGSWFPSWEIKSYANHKYVVLNRSPIIETPEIRQGSPNEEKKTPSQTDIPSTPSKPKSNNYSEFIKKNTLDGIRDNSEKVVLLKQDIESLKLKAPKFTLSDNLNAQIDEYRTLNQTISELSTANQNDRKEIAPLEKSLSKIKEQIRFNEDKMRTNKNNLVFENDQAKITLENKTAIS